MCYLHSVNACCGQLGKRNKSNSYLSGYWCPKCWSTHNKCPCSQNLLQEGKDSQFAADGNYAVFNSGTGGIGKVRHQLDITKNTPLGGAPKLLID